MNYKFMIDRLRREEKLLEFNLRQISHDIEQLPPDMGELFEEHHQTVKRLKEIDQRIYDLQPFWRKWVGVLY